jgi:hypothetical protein
MEMGMRHIVLVVLAFVVGTILLAPESVAASDGELVDRKCAAEWATCDANYSRYADFLAHCACLLRSSCPDDEVGRQCDHDRCAAQCIANPCGQWSKPRCCTGQWGCGVSTTLWDECIATNC